VEDQQMNTKREPQSRMAKRKESGKRVTWAKSNEPQAMKAAQNGTPARRSNKPQALKEEAARLHVAGVSNRRIAQRLGLKPHTVPNMLEDSEFLRTYRTKLLGKVPAALRAVDDALADKKHRELRLKAAVWTLENTQVGVRKEEQAVCHHDDFLAGRTRQEKEFFVLHGYWPNDHPGDDEPEDGEEEGRGDCNRRK